jgi:agmatine deiminase
MKRAYFLSILIGLIIFFNSDANAQLEGLPKWMTEEEKEMLSEYNFGLKEHVIQRSISGEKTRTMAEWEEIQSIVITWTQYRPILTEIVRHAQKEAEVIIVCADSTAVLSYLTERNVNRENISFIIAPFNSIWIRDYGPNAVYLNDVDSLILVDWIYNRPRPNDNLIPLRVGAFKSLEVISTNVSPSDLVHTGGNFMSDGNGTGFSSNLVLNENRIGNPYGVSAKSESVIDSIMKSTMGIDPYIKMTVLPFDGINHIDMHMKLLDEETLLVGEYPEGIADGPQIEANIQYVIDQFRSVFGTPFRVVRIPMPPDASNRYPPSGHYRTYTNSLIVNNTILVPTYEERYDTTALRIYRENKPGYEIVGINCNSIIPAGGAIHCITKELGVHDPIFFLHQPLRNPVEELAEVSIEAEIKHRSGIEQAWVFFSTDTMLGYDSIPMGLHETRENYWVADIPLTTEGNVFYFLKAVSLSGKVMNKPMPAEKGPWRFENRGGVSNLRVSPISKAIQMEAIFPNPANAITCIPVENSGSIVDSEISLMDLFGVKIQTIHQGHIPNGSSRYFLNAAHLNPGVYYVSLRTSNSISTQKLIVR